MTILFVKVKISKLINYSTNMCRSCQATMVCEPCTNEQGVLDMVALPIYNK
jgi:hypothetical protein